MMLFEVKNKLLLGVDNKEVNTHKAVEHPPCCRCLDSFALLIREVLLLLFETLPDAVLQGRVDQQTGAAPVWTLPH